MSGQGSGGNVIAAICSFFIPGLGQLVQGRIIPAILFFIGRCWRRHLELFHSLDEIEKFQNLQLKV